MSKKYKAIIFEDNVVSSLSMKVMLEESDYECLGMYKSADNLLSIFNDLKPDFILMDIMLKGTKSGIDAVQELRTVSDNPVIFVTALNDSETNARINAIENVSHIRKPFNEHELMKYLREIGMIN